MATIGTIGITLDSLCAADNHAQITLDLNSGEKVRQIKAETSDLINIAIDDDDLAGFLRILLKLAGRGKTQQQIKTALQAGATVTIST